MKNVVAKLSTAFALVAAGAIAAPAAVAAPLFGSTVNYQYYFPTASSNYGGAGNGNVVVGTGIEVQNVADGVASLDLTGSQIVIDFRTASTFNGAPFNGWRITDVFGAIDDFVGVSLNAAGTNMAGLNASRISFTTDSISLNWAGLSFDRNTQVVLDVSTRSAANAVPEPASLALVGLALAGFGFARRRGLAH